MKKSKVSAYVAAVALASTVAFGALNAESIPSDDTEDNPTHSMKRWESKLETPEIDDSEEHTVGWYVANMKQAQDQNKVCYENSDIQKTANCVNSLRALEISFAGGGRRY